MGRVGAATCPLANVIEADVSADAEDPREHRSAFPPIEMGDHPEQRLLREVVGFARAGEVCTEAPNIALHGADEPFERCPVACLSGGGDTVEVDHTDQSAASGPDADTAWRPDLPSPNRSVQCAVTGTGQQTARTYGYGLTETPLFGCTWRWRWLADVLPVAPT